MSEWCRKKREPTPTTSRRRGYCFRFHQRNTEVGCLSSKPWRRFPRASTRVQIRQKANQRQTRAFGSCPTIRRSDAHPPTSGTLDEAVVDHNRALRPASSIRYLTVQNPRSRPFVRNHFRSRRLPGREEATKFAPEPIYPITVEAVSPPELRRKSPSRCSSSLRVLRRQSLPLA
jgi:hypothetical protein